MNKYFLSIGAITILTYNVGCKGPKTENDRPSSAVSTETGKTPEAFLPKGYVVFEKINGDFNDDGIEDCVLIIKGTDKSKIIIDGSNGQLDRNRRGIIALLKRNDGYELAVKNYDCFSSENEDGGVYFPPELSVEIKKGKLYISYAHGRYGYWKYTFRFQHADFALIGYDGSSDHGPVVEREVSINFLTGTKIVKINTNGEAESGEEVFETTTTKISKGKLMLLSEVKDFDELQVEEE